MAAEEQRGKGASGEGFTAHVLFQTMQFKCATAYYFNVIV
jgi:hypothetical protein